MNKIIGALLIIIGLVLIGVGTYQEIESIGHSLLSESNNNYHDGLYITSGDSITVVSQNENVINATINNDLYLFTYNGSYFENKSSGFYIIFSNDNLKLYRNGELIRELHKK